MKLTTVPAELLSRPIDVSVLLHPNIGAGIGSVCLERPVAAKVCEFCDLLMFNRADPGSTVMWSSAGTPVVIGAKTLKLVMFTPTMLFPSSGYRVPFQPSSYHVPLYFQTARFDSFISPVKSESE
uniref:Uncharacterized protein n=1 Tax=Candidatus Methanogaster sp. ANME-2c ERB4 TaxID=2759911 RepID=A0A7G9Y606_9EURY|nr:hypothetical protein PNPIFLLP_00001 [Methanosarcinales archaeon ANME-2c ERB4]